MIPIGAKVCHITFPEIIGTVLDYKHGLYHVLWDATQPSPGLERLAAKFNNTDHDSIWRKFPEGVLQEIGAVDVISRLEKS